MKAPGWVVGEFVGTFLLVFFGCGSVCVDVTTGALVGLFQVAIVWGVGIAMAIYLTGSLSGAHLNPAVTISLAAWDGFPKRRVAPYIAMQLLGAFAAAMVLHGLYAQPLRDFERAHAILRGAPGSEASAMVFGEYFPNPGAKPLTAAARERVSATGAFAAEAVGTAVLVAVILGLSDDRNRLRPQGLTPAMIGLTVTILICVLAPLTMAGFNPARDLGPRLWSSLAGWGRVPFQANGNGWWSVYVLAPIIGGWVGGGVYRACCRLVYRECSDA